MIGIIFLIIIVVVFLLSWVCAIITSSHQKKQQNNNINNDQDYINFWKDNNQIGIVDCRIMCSEYNKKIKDEIDRLFPEYLDIVGQYIYKKHNEYKAEQLNKKYPIRSEFYIFSYDISKVFSIDDLLLFFEPNKPYTYGKYQFSVGKTGYIFVGVNSSDEFVG